MTLIYPVSQSTVYIQHWYLYSTLSAVLQCTHTVSEISDGDHRCRTRIRELMEEPYKVDRKIELVVEPYKDRNIELVVEPYKDRKI